jgi:hypothetical protein
MIDLADAIGLVEQAASRLPPRRQRLQRREPRA